MTAPKTYGEHYDWIKSQAPTPTGPRGWIQWKGTDVCIDLHCACGHHGHFDGDFLYYWRCSQCGRVYAMAQDVIAVELPPEQREFVEREMENVIQEDQS